METNTENGTLGMSVDKTTKPESNSEQLVERIPLENTPFTAIRTEKIWFLTMGKYRLTNQLGSLEECKAEAEDMTWNRLVQVIQIMIEANEKAYEQKYGAPISSEEAEEIIKKATTKNN